MYFLLSVIFFSFSTYLNKETHVQTHSAQIHQYCDIYGVIIQPDSWTMDIGQSQQLNLSKYAQVTSKYIIILPDSLTKYCNPRTTVRQIFLFESLQVFWHTSCSLKSCTPGSDDLAKDERFSQGSQLELTFWK